MPTHFFLGNFLPELFPNETFHFFADVRRCTCEMFSVNCQCIVHKLIDTAEDSLGESFFVSSVRALLIES